MVQIGVCAGLTPLAALDRWPFDFVEVSGRDVLMPEAPEREFAPNQEALRRLPVPVSAANVLLPPDLKLVATPDRPVDGSRIERYIRTAIERAHGVGIEIIVFGSGAARARPATCRPQDAAHQIAAHLARWSDWARGSGVLFALEPLRYEETNTINTVGEGAALLRTIPDSGATLLADIFHMVCNGEAPDDLVAAVPLLSHVHVSEGQDRAPPGTYGDDFRAYFSVLRPAGYAGRISLECGWTDLGREAGPAVEAVREQWTTA
jgi:sugar phosphate isomerase/epimerase